MVRLKRKWTLTTTTDNHGGGVISKFCARDLRNELKDLSPKPWMGANVKEATRLANSIHEWARAIKVLSPIRIVCRQCTMQKDALCLSFTAMLMLGASELATEVCNLTRCLQGHNHAT